MVAELAALGTETVDQGAATIFFTALVAGWIIALMTWMVTASDATASQVLVIFTMTFVVGAGHFTHIIAGSAEAFVAALSGEVGLGRVVLWVVMALLGNTVGGVVVVALFNYGQVAADTDERDPERSLRD